MAVFTIFPDFPIAVTQSIPSLTELCSKPVWQDAPSGTVHNNTRQVARLYCGANSALIDAFRLILPGGGPTIPQPLSLILIVALDHPRHRMYAINKDN